MARVSTVVTQPPSNNAEVECLRRILQLTSVVCSVRQGSQLSSGFLRSFLTSSSYYQFSVSSTLFVTTGFCFAKHPKFPSNRDRSPQLFNCSPYSRGHVHSNECRTFLHHRSPQNTQVWSFTSWWSCRAVLGRWKLAALLALFRSTGDLLTIEPKQMLCLCASLCHSNKLGEVDIMWRHTIDLWLCE